MSKPKTIAATYKRVTLRLPPELYEALQQHAASARRPFNTDAILLLSRALKVKVKDPTA